MTASQMSGRFLLPHLRFSGIISSAAEANGKTRKVKEIKAGAFKGILRAV